MKTNYLFLLLALVSTLFITSCDKDDPPIVEEPEIITTVIYTLTPTNGEPPVVLTFRDLDGENGNAPVVTGGTLAANQTYNGTIECQNESVMPTEDITEEILEEDEDHQFFFSTTVTDLNINYSDQDSQGNPVGLSNTITTGGIYSGTITVILKHLPEKFATGVSEGDITFAGGDTDVEATFPIDVE